MRSAVVLAYRMEWEFGGCPRKNFADEGDTIKSLTPWNTGACDETVFHSYYYEDLFKRRFFTPSVAWQLPPQYPHTMFILQHNIQEQERLFRGEVMSILAAIITRMELPELSEHMVIPVFVLSFMGKQHGRIPQAFYNGTVLNIWMSKLFDFTTLETAEPNFRIFLQQMTNQPVGTMADQMPMELPLRQR
ncbi:hypothetical protein AWENTII_010933 [Aspergillus wentii]